MNWTAKAILYLFAFAGVGFLLLGLCMIFFTRKFLEESIIGEGTVIAIDAHPARSTIKYSPRVRFMTDEGKEIEVQVSFRETRTTYSIGQKVRVRYEESHPDTAILDRLIDIWFKPVFALGLGLGFTMLSGLTYWLSETEKY